jgi:hypothetical protein
VHPHCSRAARIPQHAAAVLPIPPRVGGAGAGVQVAACVYLLCFETHSWGCRTLNVGQKYAGTQQQRSLVRVLCSQAGARLFDGGVGTVCCCSSTARKAVAPAAPCTIELFGFVLGPIVLHVVHHLCVVSVAPAAPHKGDPAANVAHCHQHYQFVAG